MGVFNIFTRKKGKITNIAKNLDKILNAVILDNRI